jgi:hypothetical protein
MAGFATTLRDVLTGIQRSAPAYASRLDRAKSIIRRHRRLRNEAARLPDSLARKSHSCASYAQHIDRLTRRVQQAQADFDAEAAAFRKLVLRDSAICHRHGDDPYILCFCGVSSRTPHSVRSRLRARAIEVRARILRKMERLRRLRRSVFCSDDGAPSLGEQTPIDDSTNEFADALARNVGDEAAVMPDGVSQRLAKLVQAAMTEDFDAPQVDFFRLSFARPRKLRQDFGRILGKASPPRASPATGKLWREIREINERIPHLSPVENALISADTIVEASRALQIAQMTINHLDLTRRSESPEIARGMTRVTSLMSDLVSLLRHLPHFQARALRTITVPTQLSLYIDVVSHAQYDRVFGLIHELEQTLSQTLELQPSHFESLAGHLAVIRRPAESDKVAAAPSDELARLQDEQLRVMQSIIESLPDSIDISDDVPLEPLEIPVLTLPTPAPKVFATSDPFHESNLHLIEQIEKRKFEPEELPVAAGERRVITDESQRVLDGLTKAMEVPDIDVREMELKKEELLARLAEAQGKLDAAASAAPERAMEELREKLRQRETEVGEKEAQLVKLRTVKTNVTLLLEKTKACLEQSQDKCTVLMQRQKELQRIEDDIRSVKAERDELAKLFGLREDQAMGKDTGE